MTARNQPNLKSIKYGKNAQNIDKLNEITLGDYKYYHESDEDYDYLISIDTTKTNGVKVKLCFTKDVERHKQAIEGLKIFFSGINWWLEKRLNLKLLKEHFQEI